jgi:hypothetical protein
MGNQEDMFKQPEEIDKIDKELVTVVPSPPVQSSTDIIIKNDHLPENPWDARIDQALQLGNVEAMERLFDLQQKWEANEARKAFIIAMDGFKNDCPPLEKKTQGHNSKYAALDDIMVLIRPVLSKWKLNVGWVNESVTDKMVVTTCTIEHIAGHSKSYTEGAPPDDSGSKNKTQARGSALTYLQRYTLLALLGVVAERDRDGGDFASVTDRRKELIQGVESQIKARGSKWQGNAVELITSFWVSLGNHKNSRIDTAGKLDKIERSIAQDKFNWDTGALK